MAILLATIIIIIILALIGQNILIQQSGDTDTNHKSYKEKEIVWSTDQIIKEDVEIDEKTTLIISPGVKIICNSGVVILIKGTLIANGNRNNPINFSSNITAKWDGIKLRYGSTANIKYCIISGAEIGISLRDCDNITINNCIIQNNWCGILLSYTKDCEITNNNINENYGGGGIWIEGAYSNQIYHNNFKSNFLQIRNIHQDYGKNKWDNGDGEGNYWDDYDGTDLDRDGIGDTELPCHQEDYYPFMKENGWL